MRGLRSRLSRNGDVNEDDDDDGDDGTGDDDDADDDGTGDDDDDGYDGTGDDNDAYDDGTGDDASSEGTIIPIGKNELTPRSVIIELTMTNGIPCVLIDRYWDGMRLIPRD